MERELHPGISPSEPAREISVVITDNRPFFRKGLRKFLDLQPDIRVVGEVRDGREAYHLLGQYQPDVVLMVVRMPVKEGIEISQAIRERYQKVQIVFLFAFDEEEFFPEGPRIAAIGYPTKDPFSHQILRALRWAVQDECYHAPSYDAKPGSSFGNASDREVRRAAANAHLIDPLTQPEFEVLEQICEGRDNSEIAASLHLTVGTVKNYASKAYKKMGVRNRREAVVKAREIGLI